MGYERENDDEEFITREDEILNEIQPDEIIFLKEFAKLRPKQQEQKITIIFDSRKVALCRAFARLSQAEQMDFLVDACRQERLDGEGTRNFDEEQTSYIKDQIKKLTTNTIFKEKLTSDEKYNYLTCGRDCDECSGEWQCLGANSQ